MTRYWHIAQELYPHLKKTDSTSVWRRLARKIIGDIKGSEVDPDVIAAMACPATRAPQETQDFPRTTHVIGSLGAGGAERQLVNLLLRLKARGHDGQTLLTVNPLQGDDAHYAELLQANGVEIRTNNSPVRDEGVELLRTRPETVDLLMRLPPAFGAWSLDLWVELSLLAPDVAHFWLDHSNIWGGPAALLADIPAVVLSTRNVHPANFPYLYAPYMREWYGWLETCRRVSFINNSHAGAASYAEWLGVEPNRFQVVLNGVELSHMNRCKDEERAAVRSALNIPSDARVIVGAFRLSDEKRPILFVETAARAMATRADVYVVLMGDGPLREAVEERAAQLGVADRTRILGRRKDISSIMSSCDVLLHTAWWEGTPNVVLEAQQLELPVVVSAGGGAADAVAHDRTGLLIDRSDDAALSAALDCVLDDLAAWRVRAADGPQFIAERFSVDRMVDETISVQRRARAAITDPPRLARRLVEA